jgi:hypothetical protein
VLLSTPLHASSNFTVSVQLANKRGLQKKKYNDQVKDEMGRACSKIGGKWNAYRILVGKPKGRRQLGRPTRRWVDSIKIDLKIETSGKLLWTR